MDMLSPGISGDNPNFGLAMWSQGDNFTSNNMQGNTGYPGFTDSQGYPPFMDSFAPQGPMATPGRPGGHVRDLLSSGPPGGSLPVGMPGIGGPATGMPPVKLS